MLKNIYTIIPSQQNAQNLEAFFRKKLQISMIEIIDCCENLISTETTKHLKNNIRTLCQHNTVSPFLYGINRCLITAIEKDNVTIAIEFLQILQKLSFIQKSFKLTSSDLLENKDLKQIYYDSDPMRIHDNHNTPTISPEILQNFERAIFLLKNYLPDLYTEHLIFNKIFLLFTKGSTSQGSSFNTFGLSIFQTNIFEMTSIEVLEAILHETAHHYLYTVFAIDPLVLNHSDQKYINPFRTDPRPMTGIYHAFFVLARICLALQTLIRNCSVLTPKESAAANSLHTKNHHMYKECQKIISQHAILTENGKTLTESIINNL